MEAVGLSGITKRFGTFCANRDVSLSIRAGSIHAIVGENGAGKSTLTKIIYGMHAPSSGSMTIKGQPAAFSSPRDAIEAGIGMVHQHFMLTGGLTVTENIMLGQERQRAFGLLDTRTSAERIAAIARNHGMEISPDTPVRELSVGEEQRVEIIKLLFRNADILILDEPTAVLTPEETGQLFRTLRSLQEEGKTIILITHKLDEVLRIADTVSVMRKGEIVDTLPVPGLDKQSLARMMVGRQVLLRVNNPPAQPQKVVLDISALSLRDHRGRLKLDNLSLQVREGEIYGIAGVEGNGQSELLELLWGMRSRHRKPEGRITVDGRDVSGMTARDIAGLGVSHIPEDRLRHAVIADYPVPENLIFGRHREQRFQRGAGFNRAELDAYTREMTEKFDIRYDPDPALPISRLSGGNQQKIVLARELNRPGLRLLVLAQPTRGVDIGAIELIHNTIIAARQEGIAVLLISAELDEIMTLSTRIGCLYGGRIRHEFSDDDVIRGRRNQREFEQEIGMHIT
ncbi:ABC transporter ATP-binding protein [Prosthecochloris sp. ZM_2]|uniref:ABC transporter ATP-binding protein n=1 Tax=Prosthecochloris sp. ZM_2 TaxID=2045206 RepID=UPI000DF72AFE|nr:ABC transporter ATP-binding protein [Prosthecochloris sp. ZM_2]RNA66127.1 ABC transporter ATP-binding protein [Prosthecochloris sp. ZM_2]